MRATPRARRRRPASVPGGPGPHGTAEPGPPRGVAPRDDAHERHRRGTRRLLLARACVFVGAYVVSAILARQLGAADYGTYGVIVSQLLWLELAVHAGIPGATAQLIAHGRRDPAEIERSARALLLGLAALLLAAGWVLAPRVAALTGIANGAVLFRLALLDLPLAAIYASYEGALYGRHRFGTVAGAQVVHSAAKVAAVGALVGLGVSLAGALLATVLATGTACVVLAALCGGPRLRPTAAILRELATISAPMALYLLAGQALVNLDLWALKSLWPGEDEVVGEYVASANLARTLAVIPAIQAGVLFASVTSAVGAGHRARARGHLAEATRFAVLMAVGGCVVLGLDGSAVLAVLFSEAYAGGARFLPFQLAGFAAFALLDAFALSLMAAGRRWLAAGVAGATVPLVGLANLLLIPRLGPLGAATSMVLGPALAAAVAWALASRHFGPFVPAATLGRVLLAAALVGLVSAAVPVGGPLVLLKLAAVGGLYVLVLAALGEISARDFGLPARRPADRSA